MPARPVWAAPLQDALLPETWLLLGIDAFWLSLPPRELDLERVAPAYYAWDVHVEGGLEYFRITPGPILDRVMLGRTRAIAQFLELGLNVADDVIWKREWLLDALRIFALYQVYFVGVFVSEGRVPVGTGTGPRCAEGVQCGCASSE